ncbi:STAS domain-containing protein [Nonomuraea zeae]|uniref:STAS domain-containing protein n=1 Tax=Nonomuraea zeae TaxID=1642303 RepID=A0A5S4G9P3_9ACTN|nr:STAS domain-containing protein [Nonomuraea zeae]TMR29727.1 hypothetical protein ETD85_31565 [Nonomuraea zeae]
MSHPRPARPGGEDFSIRTRTRGAVLLIQPAGSLSGAPVDMVRMYLASALATHLPPRIVLDIEALTGCDDAGYEVMKASARQARDSGGRLIVTGGAHVLPADHDLDVLPTARDALGELTPAG